MNHRARAIGNLEQRIHDAERNLFAAVGADVDEFVLELAQTGLRVRVLSHGRGPAVVLLHGASESAAIWAPLFPELRHFRLLAVDLPGHGLSDPITFRRGQVREHARRLIDDILDALGLDEVPVIGKGQGPADVAAAPDSLIEALRLSARRPENARTVATLMHAIDRFRRPRPESVLTSAELAAITTPTIFILGSDDPYLSIERARPSIDQIHGATLYEMPGGHAPWLIDAQRAAELIATRSPSPAHRSGTIPEPPRVSRRLQLWSPASDLG